MSLDGTTKGLPVAAVSADELMETPWPLLSETTSFPVAVLRREAMRHNLEWMTTYCRAQGIGFAPHGKTPMIPELFDRQMQAGAFAITLADMRQVRIAVEHGVAKILLANEVVNRADIRYLMLLLKSTPHLEFYCLVDSVEGVYRLANGARECGVQVPIRILLEGGVAGGRCGVRTIEEAGRVLDALEAVRDVVHLHGVEGYEGVFAPDEADAVEKVADFVDFLVEIARLAENRQSFDADEVLLTAGGTKFHDIVVERFKRTGLATPVRIVIRSGCYLFHDHGIYEHAFQVMRGRSAAVRAAGSLMPALEVWAQVLSRPEPHIAILNAGKRDCPCDAGMPTVLRGFRPSDGRWLDPLPDHRIFKLHDQHGYLNLPTESTLRIGDLVSLGISHPCTLFDKWRAVLDVDENYNVLGILETYF